MVTPAIRASRWNQTELDFGNTKFRVLGRHTEVGRQRNFEASAEGVTIDRGNRDLGELFDRQQ